MLGAQQGSVREKFLRYALTLTAIGFVCGLAAAVPLSRLRGSLLCEVSPADPMTFAAVSAMLVGAAALAAYPPSDYFFSVG